MSATTSTGSDYRRGTVLGNFTLTEPIAQTAFSEIWEGLDRSGRLYALKLANRRLPPDSRSLVERSLRHEWNVNQVLRSPRVITCLAHHETPAMLVMERVQGQSLAEIATARLRHQSVWNKLTQPVLWPDFTPVARQAAEALAFVHRRGVFHLDIKPGNFMMDDSGIKLIDFALSRVTVDSPLRELKCVMHGYGVEDTNVTGDVVSSPSFVAPERIKNPEPISASDVYSLGAAFYFCYTGRLVFDVSPSDPDRVVKIVRRHLNDPPPRLKHVPRPVSQLIGQMLAKDPSDRPTAAQVAHELSLFG